MMKENFPPSFSSIVQFYYLGMSTCQPPKNSKDIKENEPNCKSSSPFVSRYLAGVAGENKNDDENENGSSDALSLPKEQNFENSQWTIILPLNQKDEDFFGGGTYFHRYGCTANLDSGKAYVFPSKVTHFNEEIKTTAGRRYSLVSFMDPLLDEKDISEENMKGDRFEGQGDKKETESETETENEIKTEQA